MASVAAAKLPMKFWCVLLLDEFTAHPVNHTHKRGHWAAQMHPPINATFLTPLNTTNREPCSYSYPGFGTQVLVSDGLGKNGKIGVTFRKNSSSDSWTWVREPADSSPDSTLGEIVFGKLQGVRGCGDRHRPMPACLRLFVLLLTLAFAPVP